MKAWQEQAMSLWRDAIAALEMAADRGGRGLVMLFVGLALGWWIYVPLHELLHAVGCLLAGGRVTRLEIDGIYGGALLAKFIPFVRSGGEYAGRLSGFDTGGSDLVYLLTDLAPYLLTLFPGVFWLRRAARARLPLLAGAALPWALAPVISLTGDAYEIGALLVRQLPPWARAPWRDLILGDDLFKKVLELSALSSAPWAGLVLAALVGIAWAVLTYTVASLLATVLGAPPAVAAPPSERPR